MVVGAIVDILILVLRKCIGKVHNLQLVVRFAQRPVNLLGIRLLVGSRKSGRNLILQNRIGVWHQREGDWLVVHLKEGGNHSVGAVQRGLFNDVGAGIGWVVLVLHDFQLFHQVMVVAVGDPVAFDSAQTHIGNCFHANPVVPA